MKANNTTILLNAAAYVRNETIINGSQAAQLDSLTNAISELTAIVERNAAKIAERIAAGNNVEMLERMTARYEAKLSDAVASLRAWLVDFKNNRPNVQINIDEPESTTTTEPQNTPATMNANEPELTAEQAAYYNAMLTPSDESASLAWESEPKTDEELTALGVDAFGDNENANEIDANHISESISRLRYELQEYHNNASKGGANRQRNMTMLAEDIARLEASANEITVTVHQVAPGHWQASANGVKFGWVCTWDYGTFAACMNIGIREQKALAPFDLWNEQRGTYGHKTESAAVASLSEMITSYFAKYGYTAKALNA